MNKHLNRLALAVPAMLLTLPAWAEDAAPKLDSGDTAWMLTSTALVLMMTIPGLALFYAGMVRKKNILATMMQSFMITCLITVTWMIAGYSLAFTNGSAYLGDFSRLFLNGLGAGWDKPFILGAGTDTISGALGPADAAGLSSQLAASDVGPSALGVSAASGSTPTALGAGGIGSTRHFRQGIQGHHILARMGAIGLGQTRWGGTRAQVEWSHVSWTRARAVEGLTAARVATVGGRAGRAGGSRRACRPFL